MEKLAVLHLPRRWWLTVYATAFALFAALVADWPFTLPLWSHAVYSVSICAFVVLVRPSPQIGQRKSAAARPDCDCTRCPAEPEQP